MIGEKDQFHYFRIKDINTFIYNQTLHGDRKHFCHYCLQSYSTVQILDRHVNDCFEINCKQMIKMDKKGESVKCKTYMRKTKLPFMIYADFEKNFVLENNGKNSYESYTNKYHKCQNHVGCSFVYKLLFAGDQFSKPSESYLGQETVHKFRTNLFGKSNYCSRVMKGHFNKDLVMAKEDNQNLKALQNVAFVIIILLKVMSKWDHFHITGKYIGVEHKDFDIKI